MLGLSWAKLRSTLNGFNSQIICPGGFANSHIVSTNDLFMERHLPIMMPLTRPERDPL